jgi:general secretion pathway protein C
LILNVALVAAGALVLLASARSLVRSTPIPELNLKIAAPPATQVRSFDRYASIAQHRLFGARPSPRTLVVPEAEKLAASRLQVQLIGTAAASDPAISAAVLLDEKTKEKVVVRLNDLLSGARVVRIERKRVVVERNGKLEQIVIDDEPNAKKVGARRAASRRPRPRPRAAADLSQRVRQLAKPPAQARKPPVQSVLTQARIVPRYGDDGQLGGLELSAIRPGSLLESAGLENGDLVLGVNGTRVSDPAQGLQAFRELSNPDTFVLEVDRGGEVLTLEYTPEEQ